MPAASPLPGTLRRCMLESGAKRRWLSSFLSAPVSKRRPSSSACLLVCQCGLCAALPGPAWPCLALTTLVRGVSCADDFDNGSLELPQPTMRQLHEVRQAASASSAAAAPAAAAPQPSLFEAKCPMLKCTGMPCLQEAGLMASMHHPNVVNFLGICSLPPCILTGERLGAAPGCTVAFALQLCLGARLHTDDAACLIVCELPSSEFCSRGSIYDLMRRASRAPQLAAELTWQRRLTMVRPAGPPCTCTL